MRGILESKNDSVVCVHDALAQGEDIVNHLIVGLCGIDGGSLLQNLHNNSQVLFKSRANSLCNITKVLENGWLERLVKIRTLQIVSKVFNKLPIVESTNLEVVEQVVHKVIAIRRNLVANRTRDVANKANRNRALGLFLLVAESLVQEWNKGIQILGKVFLEGVCKSCHHAKQSLRHNRRGREHMKDGQDDVHNPVGKGFNLLVKANNDARQN